MDLTNDDDTEVEMASAYEPEDVKPMSNTDTAQADTDFWCALYLANCTSQSGFSTPDYMNSQLLQAVNPIASNEYGTSQTLPRDLASGLPIVRNPIAVQALPALSPTLGVQQRPRTSFNHPILNNTSLTSQASQSITSQVNALSAICSDLERQQHFARPRLNLVQGSDIASSSLHHGSRTTQNLVPQDRSFTNGQSVVGHQVPSQLQSASRVSTGFHGFTNSHLEQIFNSRTPPALSQSPSVQSSRSHVMQESAHVGMNQTPSSFRNQQGFIMAAQRAALARQSSPMPPHNQTPRTGPSLSVNAGGFRGSPGDQRGNIGGPVQEVSGANGLGISDAEQDWRPTGRMRGSLSGQAYSAALNQFIIWPTQPTEKVRPAQNLTPAPRLSPAPHLTRTPHLASPPPVPSQLPTNMTSPPPVAPPQLPTTMTSPPPVVPSQLPNTVISPPPVPYQLPTSMTSPPPVVPSQTPNSRPL